MNGRLNTLISGFVGLTLNKCCSPSFTHTMRIYKAVLVGGSGGGRYDSTRSERARSPVRARNFKTPSRVVARSRSARCRTNAHVRLLDHKARNLLAAQESRNALTLRYAPYRPAKEPAVLSRQDPLDRLRSAAPFGLLVSRRP